MSSSARRLLRRQKRKGLGAGHQKQTPPGPRPTIPERAWKALNKQWGEQRKALLVKTLRAQREKEKI